MARQFEFLPPKMHSTSAKLIQKVVINVFIKTSFKNCGITLTAIFYGQVIWRKETWKANDKKTVEHGIFLKVHTH